MADIKLNFNERSHEIIKKFPLYCTLVNLKYAYSDNDDVNILIIVIYSFVSMIPS